MGQFHSQELCTEPACIHAASTLLKGLAPNWRDYDPCTQFDKMVCYGAFEHHGEDIQTSDLFTRRTKNLLRQVLEAQNHTQAAGIKSTVLDRRGVSADEANFQMIRDAYAACMDINQIVQHGVQPLGAVLEGLYETWPVNLKALNRTLQKSDYEGLQAANILVSQYGAKVFHSDCFEDAPVLPDPLNSGVNRVCFNAPRPAALKYEAYSDENVMNNYIYHMATVFELVMPNITNSNAAVALATQAFYFGRDLVATFQRNSPKTVEEYWLSFENVTVAELGKLAPPLGLDKLVKALTPNGQTPDSILLRQPKVWKAASELMQEYSAAAIFGHLVWETISPWLDHVYHPKLDDYVGWLYNEKDRDDRCIDYVSEMLPYILDRYYISATYTDQAHKTVDRMAGRIRKQFVKAVKESTWMSDEAKQRAATKLERIQQNIAYQKSDPDVRSAESLQKYYTGLNITADSHLYNYLQAKYLQTVRTYEKVGKAPHRGVLKQTILANAFYDPTLNSIQINAGYSQLPTFHPDVPAYVQYAGLGSVIGHEFGHSIDSNGRWHDENAEVRAWWDNATVANYEKRAQCFVDQYSEYTMPGLTVNVNGERTLGENLADAGGLRAAYEAWVEERKEMPDVWDQNLPGLEDFTHEQLFFLFWGIRNCDTYSPAIIERVYVPDEHAPNLVRLLAGADNSKAFKEAWGCKVKEPKCTLF